VPALQSYDFATIRVAPRVDREEFVNAGVIVYCREQRFLGAQVHLDETLLRSLWPEADIDSVRQHIEALRKVCAGDPDAGPIAKMTARERFHWLVAPRSTVIQISPVHTGLCDSPEAALQELFRRLVLR
jgi:hypothetical protein